MNARLLFLPIIFIIVLASLSVKGSGSYSAISDDQLDPIQYWEYNNTKSIYDIIWSPNEKYFAFVDGSLKLFYHNGTEYCNLTLANMSISALSWSPDSRFLALGIIRYDNNSLIMIYDIITKDEYLHTPIFYNTSPIVIEWPKKDIVFITLSNNTIILYNISSNTFDHLYINSEIIDASYDSESNLIGIIYREESEYRLLVINISGSVISDILISTTYKVYDLNWLPNGKNIIVSKYNCVLIYDINGSLINSFSFHYPVTLVKVGRYSYNIYVIENIKHGSFVYSSIRIVSMNGSTIWVSKYMLSNIGSLSISTYEKYFSISIISYYPNPTNKIVSFKHNSMIIIKSSDFKDKVYLDDEYIGLTPLSIITSPGLYNITIINQLDTYEKQILLKPFGKIYYDLYTVYKIDSGFLIINFSEILNNEYFILNITSLKNIDRIKINDSIIDSIPQLSFIQVLLKKGVYNITCFHILDYKPYTSIVKGESGEILNVAPIFNEPALTINIYGYNGVSKLVVDNSLIYEIVDYIKLYLPIGSHNITIIPFDNRYFNYTTVIYLSTPYTLNVQIAKKPCLLVYINNSNYDVNEINITINDTYVYQVFTNNPYEIYIPYLGVANISIDSKDIYGYYKIVILEPNKLYNVSLVILPIIGNHRYKYIILPSQDIINYIIRKNFYILTFNVIPLYNNITLFINNTLVPNSIAYVISSNVINITITYEDYTPLQKLIIIDKPINNITFSIHFVEIASNMSITIVFNDKEYLGIAKIIVDEGSYTIYFRSNNCLEYRYAILIDDTNETFIRLNIPLKELPHIPCKCILVPINDSLSYIYNQGYSQISFNVRDFKIIISNITLENNVTYIISPGTYTVYFIEGDAKPYVINISIGSHEYLTYNIELATLSDIEGIRYVVPIKTLNQWLINKNLGILNISLSKLCRLLVNEHVVKGTGLYLIKPGTYNLEIICGSSLLNKSIVINKGYIFQIGNATLLISSVYGGYVFIDGVYYGYVDPGSSILISVYPGNHSVSIAIPNKGIRYNSSASYIILFDINGYRELVVNASKVVLRNAIGSLYIDDTYIGHVNGDIGIVLIEGQHTVKVDPENIFFNPYVKIFSVEGNRVITVQVSYNYSLFTYLLIISCSLMGAMGFLYVSVLRPKLYFEIDREEIVIGLAKGITIQIYNRGFLTANKKITILIGDHIVFDKQLKIKGRSSMKVFIPIQEDSLER